MDKDASHIPAIHAAYHPPLAFGYFLDQSSISGSPLDRSRMWIGTDALMDDENRKPKHEAQSSGLAPDSRNGWTTASIPCTAAHDSGASL
jgi:hypothetical protein